MSTTTMGAFASDTQTVMRGMWKHTTMGLLIFAVLAAIGDSPLNLETGKMNWWFYGISFVGALICMILSAVFDKENWKLGCYYGMVYCLSYISVPSVQLVVADGGQHLVLISALLTAAITGTMAFIGYTTKMDTSKLGTICFVALIGIVVAGLVNLYIGSTWLMLALSVGVIIVMMGCIVVEVNDITTGKQTSVAMASIGMFLNILNMFLNILQILSALSGDDD